MQWGLVPSWAKEPGIGNKLINARAETIQEKPSFKVALSRRRCLIPADGFYEWKTEEEARQPMHIRRKDGELFAFAGLWEEWQQADYELVRCTGLLGRLVSSGSDRPEYALFALPQQPDKQVCAPG